VVTRHHRWGFPCCVGPSCASMPSPLPRQGHEVLSLVPSRGGSLPRFYGGSAPALRVSRPARRSLHVTACLLAESLNDPLHRRLRPLRYLHSRFGCYRLERPVAGWEWHPLKIRAFARRTQNCTLRSAPWGGLERTELACQGTKGHAIPGLVPRASRSDSSKRPEERS
jgi:hypothetical protein